MSKEALEGYWRPAFETFYDTYYQELVSAALIARWQRIEVAASLLVAITASGSAVAGWTLWNTPGGKWVWATVAGAASLASIVHTVLGVSGKLKEQEEVRRAFSELRVDIETFLQQLRLGLGEDETRTKYDKLRERFAQSVGRVRPEIVLTGGLRKEVQAQLNGILKVRGYLV